MLLVQDCVSTTRSLGSQVSLEGPTVKVAQGIDHEISWFAGVLERTDGEGGTGNRQRDLLVRRCPWKDRRVSTTRSLGSQVSLEGPTVKVAQGIDHEISWFAGVLGRTDGEGGTGYPPRSRGQDGGQYFVLLLPAHTLRQGAPWQSSLRDVGRLRPGPATPRVGGSTEVVFLIRYTQTDNWPKRLRAGRRVGVSARPEALFIAPPFVPISDEGRSSYASAEGLAQVSPSPRYYYDCELLSESQCEMLQAPQQPSSWSGVRDATKLPHTCLQLPKTGSSSEDCLYINVYTPQLPSGDRNASLVPVMVHIHGGAFVTGSGNRSPGQLMNHGVVVAAFNYRLNLFGECTKGFILSFWGNLPVDLHIDLDIQLPADREKPFETTGSEMCPNSYSKRTIVSRHLAFGSPRVLPSSPQLACPPSCVFRQATSRFKAPAYRFYPRLRPRSRGNDKGDIVSPIKYVIATKPKSLNWRFMAIEGTDAPGNAGLKDQEAALRWIQKNIQHFGGNPESVTIMGESAGGASVHYHILSPVSKGLFHKAISESGSALASFAFVQNKNTQKSAFQLSSLVGRPANTTTHLIAQLREASATQLIEALANVTALPGSERPFAPCVEFPREGEEHFLLHSPQRLLREGEFASVPYIAGSTKHEAASTYTSSVMASESFWKSVNAKLEKYLVPYDLGLARGSSKSKEVEQKVKNFYFGGEVPSNKTRAQWVNLETDLRYALGVVTAVHAHAKHSTSKTYNYQLSFPPATHAMEWLYVVYGGSVQGQTSRAANLARSLGQLWTSFAKTGEPTAKGEVTWKPVSKGSYPYLDINPPNTLKTDVDKDRMNFWFDIYEKYYNVTASPIHRSVCLLKFTCSCVLAKASHRQSVFNNKSVSFTNIGFHSSCIVRWNERQCQGDMFTSLGRYSLSAGVDRSLVRDLGHPDGYQLACGGEEKLTPSPLHTHQKY
ncbi:hypothetical protein PR048_025689 [Dryococelus australis]|uniref:Carboxylesterase type B domain-containing protein n=1 Tax=Dryococelus australis TaxID=614101 RepID=A0ABQ9GJ84_9NEOP|nr:hypothetical protein PR048_025689 [Dryococelus australis]